MKHSFKRESFFVDKNPISHRYFCIELCTSKLGRAISMKIETLSGRKLLEIANQLRLINQKALYYQMHQLVQGVMEALKACGVLQAIQISLNGKIRNSI